MNQYIGRLLDNRYEILEIIGTGGMAVVYKALCHRLNRLVAIKILKDEYFRALLFEFYLWLLFSTNNHDFLLIKSPFLSLVITD